MFCEKCGAKNERGAKFCEKCGAAQKAPEKKKINFEMTKKNKIIIASFVAVLIVLIGGFFFLKNSISPEKEAIRYFEAVMNQDADKLYDYVEAPNSKLTSKKVFKELYKTDKKDKMELVNYKVTKVDEISDLYMTITVEYVIEDSSRTYEAKINFIKQKKKKYFLFDDWKIDAKEIRTIEDNQLKVLAGSKVTIAGVDLSKSEINKKKSNKSFDIYDLPVMFKEEYPVKVSLPLGFDIETSIYPTTYTKLQIVEIDEDNLTDKAKEELETAISTNLKTIYDSAIANKKFDDIKSNFESKNSNLKELEKSYNTFAKSLNERNRKLTSIKFTDIDIRDMDITDDGKLEIYFKVDYDYSIKYKLGNEEKTSNDDSYTYAYMDFNYDNGYKVLDFRNLNYYFY